jgi:glycosyltransferase involved in cell wall biosynthesis
MKILIVSNLFPPSILGGYELTCSNVTRELRARGHDVLVATSPSQVPGEADPPHVRRCLVMSAHVPVYDRSPAGYHATDISNFHNVTALRELLIEFEPDLVFLWNTHGICTLHLIDFLNVHDVPWCIYLGDRVFEQLVNATPAHVRAAFRGDDPSWFASGGVMSVSQHLIDEIESMGRFTFPKPPVIVHGFASPGAPMPVRPDRNGRPLRFMAAARVSEHKGINLVCDAAALLVQAGVDDFLLDIYGDGEVAFYVNYVHSLGLADRVAFHGAVSQAELHRQFRAHDMFVFPTWSREPFAFVPFEAAAYGCVPILTEDCGCAERIVDGVHGIKIERTAPALADAMRRAVQGEIDVDRMAVATAAMVRGDLSIAGHVDKILRVLEAQLRPWNVASVSDRRALLLAFIKHHLSLAVLAGAAD